MIGQAPDNQSMGVFMKKNFPGAQPRTLMYSRRLESTWRTTPTAVRSQMLSCLVSSILITIDNRSGFQGRFYGTSDNQRFYLILHKSVRIIMRIGLFPFVAAGNWVREGRMQLRMSKYSARRFLIAFNPFVFRLFSQQNITICLYNYQASISTRDDPDSTTHAHTLQHP